MADNFRVNEDGLLLSDATMVAFEDGCSDSMAIVLGRHEVGAEIPCPDCDGEHRIASAVELEQAHNIEITEVADADPQIGEDKQAGDSKEVDEEIGD